MKHKPLFILSVLAYVLIQNFAFAQGISINQTGNTADASAILDVSDTAKGILVPRMTETQKNGIPAPATGLMIYQTDGTDGYYYWDGSQWKSFSTGGGGGGTGWLLSGNAGTSPGTDFLGTTDAQDLVIKTKNSEQIRIDTSGNVGIATDTAYTKLVVNGGFTTSPSSIVNITTDSTLITVGNRSYIKVNSTRTLAPTAIVFLTDGLEDGQQLTLYNSSSSSYFIRLNEGGNISLSRDYLDMPGGSCVTMFWDGNKWIEISRRIILPSNKVTYNRTGGDQTFLVPEGVYSIEVKVWGAGGTTNGGGAAFVNAYVGVVPGQTVTVMVGSTNCNGGSVVYGGGGISYNYGCGGGRSAIIIGGVEVVTAGGGGGGSWNSGGGAAGGVGSNGADGSYTNTYDYAGRGATPTAGGAKAPANCNCSGLPTNGSQYLGGNSNGSCSGWTGGGGGGGWYGGGGACGTNINTGGGGGGTSNINTTYVSIISSASGSGSTAGGNTDPDWGGAGNGGAHGKIVIYY